MPVDFLTTAQEQRYGRFAGEPPPEDIERLSPLVHEHINLHGRYYFSLTEEVQRGEPSEIREMQCRNSNCPRDEAKTPGFRSIATRTPSFSAARQHRHARLPGAGCTKERVCVKSRKTGRPTPICCGVVLVRPLHMDALRSFYTVSSGCATFRSRTGFQGFRRCETVLQERFD